jgi:hypothetical protein
LEEPDVVTDYGEFDVLWGFQVRGYLLAELHDSLSLRVVQAQLGLLGGRHCGGDGASSGRRCRGGAVCAGGLAAAAVGQAAGGGQAEGVRGDQTLDHAFA